MAGLHHVGKMVSFFLGRRTENEIGRSLVGYRWINTQGAHVTIHDTSDVMGYGRTGSLLAKSQYSESPI